MTTDNCNETEESLFHLYAGTFLASAVTVSLTWTWRWESSASHRTSHATLWHKDRSHSSVCHLGWRVEDRREILSICIHDHSKLDVSTFFGGGGVNWIQSTSFYTWRGILMMNYAKESSNTRLTSLHFGLAPPSSSCWVVETGQWKQTHRDGEQRAERFSRYAGPKKWWTIETFRWWI